MRKYIHLPFIGDAIKGNDPWALYRKNCLPPGLVTLFDNNFDVDILKTSRKSYRMNKLSVRTKMSAIVLGVLLFYFGISVIGKQIEYTKSTEVCLFLTILAETILIVTNFWSRWQAALLGPKIEEFQQHAGDLMNIADLETMLNAIPPVKVDPVNFTDDCRYLTEEVVRRAVEQGLSNRARYLREKEIERDDAKPASKESFENVRGAKEALRRATNIANRFNLGEPYAVLFAKVNPDLYARRLRAFDPVI